MRKALSAWEALPRSDRLLAITPARWPAGRQRNEQSYPEEGLALRAVTRDLANKANTKHWLAKAWNIDFAWFTASEARSMLPTQINQGGTHSVPAALVRRLARLHLVDFVRGQTRPYSDKEVEQAILTTTIVRIEGQHVSIRLEGKTRSVARGRWQTTGLRVAPLSQQERGYAPRLLGKATYDLGSKRFVSFELLALGLRWGATRYNCRSRDSQPAPQGVVFSLAGNSPTERVAPSFLWAYGWQRPR